ncbi:MAG TPA: hypothetical protein VJK51_01950 [Candidatus Nanoarchaeia archaeon]|nr:hypothetical protein [Candidatus Nanoarchaeia archaeon]
MILNVLISGFYSTLQLLVIYAKTVNWLALGISVIFSLTIGILVAINAVYGYLRYKERKNCLEGTTATGIGTVGGLLAGVCPLCITGLFPLLFGLFGLSFSLASLPFKGLEVQASAIVLLLIGLYLLKRKK